MNRKLSIKDFTKEELSQLDLQCGPANCWLGWLVPELWFHDRCVEHDIDYAAGKSKKDKSKADEKFKKEMLEDCQKIVWCVRFIAKKAAKVYYKSVVELGNKSFNYAERYATKEEIIAILRKKK